MATLIKKISEVEELVSKIKNPHREVPICLISTEFQSAKTTFDIPYIEDQLSGVATIILIQTGEATFHLANNLGPDFQVFGGAARVYPRIQHASNLESTPLVYQNTGGADRLIRIVLENSDFSNVRAEHLRNAQPGVAKVLQIIPSDKQSRAMVKTRSDELATIRQELSTDDIPLEFIFGIGDELEGYHNAKLKSFLPNFRFTSIQEVLSEYEVGQIVPVFVSKVSPRSAKCYLFPGVSIKVSLEEITGNPLDSVTDFLDRGDVVGMRLYSRPDGAIGLRMDDIDDDELCREALPIASNGKPWISEGDVYLYSSGAVTNSTSVASRTDVDRYLESAQQQVVDLDVTDHVNVGTTPNGADKLSGRQRSKFEYEIKFLKDSVKALVAELDSVKAENSRLESLVKSLENRLETAKKAATSLRRKNARPKLAKSSAFDRRTRYLEDEEWFREELRRSWLANFSPEERANKYQLNDSKFFFGDNFFSTIQEQNCSAEDLRKVIRCILDIVTGRERVEPRRDVHPLRKGSAASAPEITGENGSIALRAYVEEKTPAAKRLHFWAFPDGSVRLMRVVTHDVFDI